LVIGIRSSVSKLRATKEFIDFCPTPPSSSISIEAPSPNADGLFAGSGGLIDAVRSALAHADGTIQAGHDTRDGLPIISYYLTLPTLRE